MTCPQAGPVIVRFSGVSIFSGRGERSRRRLESRPRRARERRGRFIVERAVRPHFIVVLSPGFDDLARMIQADEPVFVEAFVAELPVEALDVGVLNRLAGPDEGLSLRRRRQTAPCLCLPVYACRQNGSGRAGCPRPW